MSVLTFGEGDLFVITIIKYLTANPERKWANNYEVRAISDGVTTDLTSLGSKLVDMEVDLHYSEVKFDRLRISTWEADSVPYDPEAFVSLPLVPVGTRDASGHHLNALNVCWDVARFPISGRFGHIYYRACLHDDETLAPAGKFTLASPSGMNTILGNAIDDAGVLDYLNGAGTVLELVMVDKSGTQVRQLVNHTTRGVAVVPFNHTWFNRTTGA